MRHLFFILFIFGVLACAQDEKQDLHLFEVEVQVYHHGTAVPHCTVYLMEYAQDFPGDDLSQYHFEVTSDEMGKATIKDVLAGEHWIYGLGFDGVDTVKGNMSIYIDPQDVDRYAKFILQVSEKH